MVTSKQETGQLVALALIDEKDRPTLLDRLEMLKELDEEWAPLLDEVRLLLETLPPDGGRRIYQLYRQIPPPTRVANQPVSPLARLQKLLLRLSDNWRSYRHFLEQADVPATNNATERVIGNWRIRSRSVRGFKTWSGLANAFTLCNATLGEPARAQGRTASSAIFLIHPPCMCHCEIQVAVTMAVGFEKRTRLSTI